MENLYSSNKLYFEEEKSIKSKFKNILKFLGPAFIVSVAYTDPGNFATNISAGSKFNYSLLWVIFWSNLMAIFLQIMSAKLGIATGYNLSQMCKIAFSRKINYFFWIVAELSAIATTMAEFLGGALGFYLLFKIPLNYSVILTGIVTLIIIYMQKYGQKVVEVIIGVLIAIISLAYAVEIFLADPNWNMIALNTIIPSVQNSQALLIAVGMLGATVMPHVIFLHSELVQDRNKYMNIIEKKKHLKLEKIDIFIAMNIAFIVNASMVIVSACVFFKQGIDINSIEDAYKSLTPLLGNLASYAFGISLLASGFSSSVVGAMTGESVMDGFIDIKLPTIVKRLITIVPGMIVIWLGVNPMKALILSQVCLSFALPVAIIPMIIITSKKEYMKEFTNSFLTNIIGWIISIIIISLNALLLYFTFQEFI